MLDELEDWLEDGLDGLELGLATAPPLDEPEEAGWLGLEDAGLELAGLLWDELGALLEEELSFNNFEDTSLAKSSPDEVVFLPPADEVALSLSVIITSSTLEWSIPSLYEEFEYPPSKLYTLSIFKTWTA